MNEADLVPDSTEKLKKLLSQVGKIYQSKELNRSVGKNEVMRNSTSEGHITLTVKLRKGEMGEVREFKYLT